MGYEMKLYKILNADGTSCHGGNVTPDEGEVGV
jgi:hypothetical protein